MKLLNDKSLHIHDQRTTKHITHWLTLCKHAVFAILWTNGSEQTGVITNYILFDSIANYIQSQNLRNLSSSVQASEPVKLDRQYLGNVPSCQTYNVWSLVRFAKMSGILYPSWLWFRFLNQTKINSFVRIQMLLPSLHNSELICALVPSTKTSLQLLKAALQPNWPYLLCTSIGIQHHQSYTNSSSRKALHPGNC